MRIAVAKESRPDEPRVALVPETVEAAVRLGAEVWVEAGAGRAACFPDAEYERAGARLIRAPAALLSEADVVVALHPPGEGELPLREGAVWICFLHPDRNPEAVEQLKRKKATVFALERMPRLSRTQRMDALSSQSTAAGYAAVILAARESPRFFPLLMTAAGTVTPAKVFVLGAGVAGLTAVATARRLGARVEAFDVRPAVREQVESLGASFVGTAMEGAEQAGGYARQLSEEARRKEQALIAERTAQADVVIATAAVPGRPAPKLIASGMVEAMKPGAVIVDLVAEQGGNCELTRPGQSRTVAEGVRILGPLNPAGAVAFHASLMYARNAVEFLKLILRDGKILADFEDPVVRETCFLREGRPLE